MKKETRDPCPHSMILDCKNGSLNRQLQHPDGTFLNMVLFQNSLCFLISFNDNGGFKLAYFIALICKKKCSFLCKCEKDSKLKL